MKTRKDIIDFCLSLKNTYEDYPFHDFNWTVMRHKDNKKMFAAIYEHMGNIWVNKENFADVRKLELVSKRYILTDGVFGVSDSVIGGFATDLDKAIKHLDMRTKTQVEKDYQKTLAKNETDNKEFVESAEDILFTTFTKEMAEKIKITPQYAEEKSKEINADLWELVKYYFEKYNLEHGDCKFEIDEEKKTVTATDYKTLPHLFY